MNFDIAQVGETILKTPAKTVIDFSSTELTEFVNALMQSMLAAKGIGIAAPQVFDERAIMIIASKQNSRYPDAPNMEPLVMINPRLVSHSEETIKGWEGCLSVPQLRGWISRYYSVVIDYQDINGVMQQVAWQGFLARIFQHEFDHLQGKTWLDRIDSVADIIAESVYMEKVKRGEL